MYRTTTQLTAGMLIAATLMYGQTATTAANGWHKVGDPASTAQAQPGPQAQDPNQAAPPQPDPGPAQPGPVQTAPVPPGPMQQQPSPYPANGFPQRPANPGTYNQAPYTQAPYNQAPYNQPVPPSLTMPAGTFITVRTLQPLSSDSNHPGDAFSATLAQPVVVSGVVIAEPGQTLNGQVVEAQKAGRIEGTARLRVHLTELTLVDGQQIPIRTQFIGRRGPTSVGRDVAGVAGTTGFGAALGAAAGWGTGAAIGAGAGAAVGVLGVLLTRGHASVIAPEEVLTFKIENSFTVDTQRSSQAFRYVQPNEYNQPLYTQAPRNPSGAAPAPIAVAPAPYYPYYYAGYPYFYGPSFSFFYGRPYYGRGFYRPYYGGFRR